jgi:hypothetical protein
LAFFSAALTASAQRAVTLVWDRSVGANVSGYNIYYGTASQAYSNRLPAGNSTNTFVSGLTPGTTYFFAATAYDDLGVESQFSNEISYQVPSLGTNQPPPSDPLTNEPPILPTIPTQIVAELTLLTVTNQATEPNLHSVTVGYSLINAPIGAAIDANGIFTWIPTRAQSATTNTIITVVANVDPYDTANPRLTATNSFIVIVRPANASPSPQPQLSVQALPGHLVQLNVIGDIGVTYELQVSTDLTNWVDFLPLTPTSSPYPFNDPASSSLPLRFYRLKSSPQKLRYPLGRLEPGH